MSLDEDFEDELDGPEDQLEIQGHRLTQQQIEEVAGLLRDGRKLPPHLFPHLFESSKEYQLSYATKARRVDILAETMAVPLQPVRMYGKPGKGSDWSDKLVLGDNLQVLKRLLELKASGDLRNEDGTDGVRLCYIDPPFATKREFEGQRRERAYQDKVDGAEFVEFLRRRLILIHELLADNGTLYLHLDTNKVHYMKVVLDEIFGAHGLLAEIIWKRTSAHGDAQRWSPVHETILVYTKSSDYIWNTPREPHEPGYADKKYTNDDGDGRGKYMLDNLTSPNPRPNMTYAWRGFPPPPKGWRYSRATLDELDRDGRIHKPKDKTKRPRLKRYWDENKGQAVDDLWTDIPPVNSQASDRIGYPTQKPVALLERIISASSNAGDLVLDCFAGSGTTAVASTSLGRRWIAIDCGKFAMYTMQARLLRAADRAPFTLYNAGLYDYQAVRDLPWEEYRDFALQLFQCRIAPERLAGVDFDGFLGDHRVLVYNFKEHPDTKIGQAFIDDIASLCGDRLGSRCFIVAPALVVEPYEDYLDVQGTRFFFLRIPYSIIAELHKRAFSELRQPQSAQASNATIESVGFDFIQTPRVACRFEAGDKDLVVAIDEFESEAYSAMPAAEPIADLAMVMVDYDYDGEVFDLDAIHYASDLANDGWKVKLPKSKIGTQLMLVYLDVFGNEHRETKTIADFVAAKKKAAKRKPATKAKKPAKATKA